MDDDNVGGQKLALVLDRLLDGRHAATVGAQELGRETERVKEVPRAFVELAGVPHHIHVTDMIAMPGINHTSIGQNRTCCAIHSLPFDSL